MFTGLVENTGRVSSIKKFGGGLRVSIKPDVNIEVQIGESISINGVCLTVVENDKDIIFEISPETLRSTNFETLKINDKVNIERALRLSDRLGGHIVTGHIDGTGTIVDKKQKGEFTFYTFGAPAGILKYLVKKGSVAVDGISLTVIDINSRTFSIAIIPHTLTATNIWDKGIGDMVNVEVDIIGKYVEKFIGKKDSDANLMELLEEKGFTQ